MGAAVEVVVPPEFEQVRGPLADLAAAALEAEGLSAPVVVSLVDERIIAGLNGRYRGVDGPTDVLSFRYADDSSAWPGEQDPSPGGEVAVCPAVVHRYALKEKEDPGRQLGWTVVHGILHLAGYDHETDRGEMRRREQELLRELEPLLGALVPKAGG